MKVENLRQAYNVCSLLEHIKRLKNQADSAHPHAVNSLIEYFVNKDEIDKGFTEVFEKFHSDLIQLLTDKEEQLKASVEEL